MWLGYVDDGKTGSMYSALTPFLMNSEKADFGFLETNSSNLSALSPSKETTNKGFLLAFVRINKQKIKQKIFILFNKNTSLILSKKKSKYIYNIS